MSCTRWNIERSCRSHLVEGYVQVRFVSCLFSASPKLEAKAHCLVTRKNKKFYVFLSSAKKMFLVFFLFLSACPSRPRSELGKTSYFFLLQRDLQIYKICKDSQLSQSSEAKNKYTHHS